MRTPHDAYFTPRWQVDALLKRFRPTGTIMEPCAGDGSISNVLKSTPGVTIVVTNDIDIKWNVDSGYDATLNSAWAEFGSVNDIDWTITNPPFNQAIEILKHAYEHSKLGVVMLLRLSFLEPTLGNKKKPGRNEWIVARPPTSVFILPRWSYTGDVATDSVTTAWMIWDKEGLQRRIEVVPLNEKGKE